MGLGDLERLADGERLVGATTVCIEAPLVVEVLGAAVEVLEGLVPPRLRELVAPHPWPGRMRPPAGRAGDHIRYLSR